MKIECVPTPSRKSLLTIYCDGEVWRQIHTTVFGRQPTLPSDCDSIEEFTLYFQKLEYKQAKNYVVRRLSMHSLPSTVLLRALRDRLVSESISERVVEECLKLGYLNDEEWTKSFVRLQSARKLGPRAIAQKLAAKGISKVAAEEALKVSGSKEQQKAAIAKLLSTRYRKRDLSDYKEKRKVVASLIRRGFDPSLIFDCLPQRHGDNWDMACDL